MVAPSAGMHRHSTTIHLLKRTSYTHVGDGYIVAFGRNIEAQLNVACPRHLLMSRLLYAANSCVLCNCAWQFLIHAGADVNVTDEEGNTPLIIAGYFDNSMETVKR